MKLRKLLALGLAAALTFTTVQIPQAAENITDNTTGKTNAQTPAETILQAQGSLTLEEAMPKQARSQAQRDITEALSPGWNLGNQLESVNSWSGSPAFPDETAWGNPKITRDFISTIRKAGFKSVRIPVSYLSKIGSKEEGYKIDETWLQRVKEVVGYVKGQGMYAIINMHGDGYSTVSGGWLLPGTTYKNVSGRGNNVTITEEEQKEIKEKYKACWKQIAEAFKDQNDKLIFESMNEVGADASTTSKTQIEAYYKNINDYNQIFVDTVRQTGGNNASRWLLVPGINTDASLTTASAGFKIPTDTYRDGSIPAGEQRIMISVHYYSPWDFCGQEDYDTTQWGIETEDNTHSSTEGLEDGMDEAFRKLKKEFIDNGYPVVIGEYGCVDKSNTEKGGDILNTKYRAFYTETLNTLSALYGLIPVYWDNGSYNGQPNNNGGTRNFGLALFDRETRETVQPEILEAIMKPFEKGAMEPTGITISEKTLKLCKGDNNVRLTAIITPAETKANLLWQSSNPEVATVTWQGMVIPKSIGTTAITAALPDGTKAICMVQVIPPRKFKAKMYVNTVFNDWSYKTFHSEDIMEIDPNDTKDQEATLSIQLTKERMQSMNTLYIKDILGDEENAEPSILKEAEVVINSVEVNGHALTLDKSTFNHGKPDDKGNINAIFDICLVNTWDVTYIPELKKGNSTLKTYLQDGNNELKMKFTIKNPVAAATPFIEKPSTGLALSKETLLMGIGGTEKVTATLTPADSTDGIAWFSDDETIASVSPEGTITAVSTGKTTIHALTSSGLEKTITVTVQKDATKKPSTDGQDQAGGNKNQTGGKDGIGSTGTEKIPVKKVTLKKVTSPKKKTIKVQWKKGSGVTGYQIRLGTNKKTTKNKKVINIKKAKTTKKTVKKLKSRKTYYVKIRAYKTVNGTKNYGAWSKVKRVKVK